MKHFEKILLYINIQYPAYRKKRKDVDQAFVRFIPSNPIVFQHKFQH